MSLKVKMGGDVHSWPHKLVWASSTHHCLNSDLALILKNYCLGLATECIGVGRRTLWWLDKHLFDLCELRYLSSNCFFSHSFICRIFMEFYSMYVDLSVQPRIQEEPLCKFLNLFLYVTAFFLVLYLECWVCLAFLNSSSSTQAAVILSGFRFCTAL